MTWMRHKSDPERGAAEPAPAASPQTSAPAPERETNTMELIVNIGQSVQIKGELNGNEDLTIDGMIDGKIVVRDHNLTIGANGRITAEVHAKTVVVIGQVTGNITADDKVQIDASGSVEGDIRAPRVAIADGARFKGSIDMERKSAPSVATTASIPAPVTRGIPRSAVQTRPKGDGEVSP